MQKLTPLHPVSINFGTPPGAEKTLVLPPPSRPMAGARRFVEERYMRDGGLVLRSWRRVRETVE
jgi:hypothetical protein